jgi:hypothetical protein
VEENAVEFRICIWSGTLGVKMVDAYILKFTGLSSAAERLDKDAWGTCDTAQMNVVA